MGKASRKKAEYRQELLARQGLNRAKTPVKNRNWFAIITTASVAVVALVIGFVVAIGNAEQAKPAPAPTSNVDASGVAVAINQETGAVELGTGAVAVEEYLDFGCPHCYNFYMSYGEDVKSFLPENQITLSIFPLGMLDASFQGTKFSSRSANALYCVAENAPDSVLDFSGAMFVNQPREGTTGLTDARIIEIAKTVGADAAEACITDGTYLQFVEQRTRAILGQDWFAGTPGLRVNGEVIADPTAFVAAIGEAVA